MQIESTAGNTLTNTKKFVVQFLAVYLTVYIFPFPFEYFQFTHFLSDGYYKLLGYIISFAGEHIFKISFPLVATNNGSGDTLYNYTGFFLFVVVAFIITIAWSITSNKRNNYNTILYYINFYVCSYLALMMIRYGLEKIIKVQFPFPYYSLNETYKDSSPMRLLWTFMGYSKAFNLFTGVIESAAGFFLLFKKTKTFGSLLSIAALTNIVVINFSYDVPVKLFAVNLLVMAFFIFLPDAKRVSNFFFRNKAVSAVHMQPNVTKRWIKPTFNIIKFVVMVTAIYVTVMQIWHKYNTSGDGAFNKTPLFGIYSVEKFLNKNDTSKVFLNNAMQWNTVSLIFPRQALIKTIDGKMKIYHFYTDTITKTITLYSDADSTNKSLLSYSQNSAALNLIGILSNDSVYISLKKQDINQFPLIKRKFHWISETPYNK
ncbi:MAG: hypothetical protein JO072_08670 [Parafilimonas sp.]|nr:hypothetical protein [Parafilimonas sp.]